MILHPFEDIYVQQLERLTQTSGNIIASAIVLPENPGLSNAMHSPHVNNHQRTNLQVCILLGIVMGSI